MKTRRIISFLLAMLMVINLMPMTVQAEETTEQTIVLNLEDIYGDGWDGASITVSYGETKESYTIEDGSSATYIIPYNASKSYTFTWNGGKYDSECSFEILVQGNQVYTCDNGDSPGDKVTFYSIDACEHSFGEGSTCTKCKQVCGVDFEHEVLEEKRTCVCGEELLKVTAEVSGIKFEGANWVAMNTEYTAQLSVLDGYEPIEMITVSINGEEITSYSFTEGKLTIPAESVNGEITITAIAEALPRYDITIKDTAFGSVTTNTEDCNAYEGQSVSLTITPDTGYLLETLTVVDENNEEISVTNNTFVMPGRAVSVTATFVKDSGDFKIEGVESGWNITDDVLIFTQSGEYTVSMASGKTKTQQIIVVEAEEVILTLQDVIINAPAGQENVGKTALTTREDTKLILVGENTLAGGNGGSKDGGLYENCMYGYSGGDGIRGSVTISGKGTLCVSGGNGGNSYATDAGNGGYGIYGTVSINGGIVVASGGAGGKDGEYDENDLNGTGTDGKAFGNVVTNGSCLIMAGADEAAATVVDAYNDEKYARVTMNDGTTHEISIVDCVNGSVEADMTSAVAGQRVTLTVTLEEEYSMLSLSVVDAEGQEVAVNDYTFYMPDSAVTVTAEFGIQTGNLMVQGAIDGFTYSDGTLTFSKSGEYTVYMKPGSTAASDVIVVDAEDVTLTLNNLNITAPKGDDGYDYGEENTCMATDGGCALTLNHETKLVLIGENTLTGGSGGSLSYETGSAGYAGGSGISGMASIFGEGSLTVCGGEGAGVVGTAGDGGAGILGDITLYSGMVTVIGGAGGKGEVFVEDMYGTPGDGGIGIAGDITLNGGMVTVIGGAGGDLKSEEYEIDESGDNGIGINGQITVADNMLVTIKAGESEAYAEVVDAYDGETYVQITVTECTEHMDAGLDGKCDNCKTIIAYIIAPTSKLLGTNETVANISMNPSNGYVSAGGSVTVTAQDMLGYTFKGWYLSSDIEAETNQIIDGKKAQSTSFAYTFEPNADIQLVAVYEAAGKVDVTFSGSDFTVSVDGGEATTPQNGTYTSQIAIGSKVTVTVTDESFINWLNENKKIVTTENTYTFTVTGNVTLTMSKKGTSGSTAMVEFVSAYNQVIASQIYDGDDTITFPDGPSKMGYTFKRWNLTQNEIYAKITDGETHITVTPVYEQDTSVEYTVTVYVDGVIDSEQTATGILPGSTKTVNAPVVDGKVFLYWTDADGNILGYDTSYFMQINKDIVVMAVYGEEAVEAKPVIAMTNVFTANYDDKNILSFSVTRDIPEGYTLVEHGMLYNKLGTITNPTEDIFILGGTGVSKYVSTATKLSGVFTLNVMVTNAKDVKVAARGYMIVKDSEGKEEIYYTDIAYISYNDIAIDE